LSGLLEEMRWIEHRQLRNKKMEKAIPESMYERSWPNFDLTSNSRSQFDSFVIWAPKRWSGAEPNISKPVANSFHALSATVFSTSASPNSGVALDHLAKQSSASSVLHVWLDSCYNIIVSLFMNIPKQGTLPKLKTAALVVVMMDHG
jgi:hypothetical protein